VVNEWKNYQSLKNDRIRAELFARAQRLPEFQVDQARQDELKAYNRWILAWEDFVNGVDELKLFIGIPVETEIMVDTAEIDRLLAEGLKKPREDVKSAIEVALKNRLDVKNMQDGLEDARRKIKVAEDALKGDVDLVASIGYESDPDSRHSAWLEFKKGSYVLGLDIDLPVDRLEQANALKKTRIERNRAQRELKRFTDQVVLSVRSAFRRLQQTRQSHEIQKRSVELAKRRVESTRLLLQAGRAIQRDVLDAQQALLEAQNAFSASLINHTIAELAFREHLGTLYVDGKGRIYEQ
jgi:outer membrane protein TolC